MYTMLWASCKFCFLLDERQNNKCLPGHSGTQITIFNLQVSFKMLSYLFNNWCNEIRCPHQSKIIFEFTMRSIFTVVTQSFCKFCVAHLINLNLMQHLQQAPCHLVWDHCMHVVLQWPSDFCRNIELFHFWMYIAVKGDVMWCDGQGQSQSEQCSMELKIMVHLVGFKGLNWIISNRKSNK